MSLAETGESCSPRRSVKANPSCAAPCLASASARALTTSGTVPGASAAARRIFSSWRSCRSESSFLWLSSSRTVSMTRVAPDVPIQLEVLGDLRGRVCLAHVGRRDPVGLLGGGLER